MRVSPSGLEPTPLIPTPSGDQESTRPVSRVKGAAASQPRAAVPVWEHEPSVAGSPDSLKMFSNRRKCGVFGMKSLDF